MCIIAGPPNALESISGTAIFAGARARGRQVLAYRMDMAVAEPVAMVLPLPIPPDSPEDAVRFIDLSAYDRLFEDLERAFPQPVSGAVVLGIQPESRAQAKTLEVHTVGSFEASFVPSMADFSRLDPRFVLPATVWDALPEYADWGFAVFQFRDVRRSSWLDRLRGRAATKLHVHPMAFEFPVRDAGQLFFPTVHVHDGHVHPSADFDHTLYAQADALGEGAQAWMRSDGALSSTVDVSRSAGMIESGQPGWRLRILGMAPNEDTVLGLG